MCSGSCLFEQGLVEVCVETKNRDMFSKLSLQTVHVTRPKALETNARIFFVLMVLTRAKRRIKHTDSLPDHTYFGLLQIILDYDSYKATLVESKIKTRSWKKSRRGHISGKSPIFLDQQPSLRMRLENLSTCIYPEGRKRPAARQRRSARAAT